MPETLAAPGALSLREPPAGLPDPNLRPPVVAEMDDPFAALHVIELFARVDRGRPILISDVAAALDARYLDWLFPPAVVAAVALQLQANWMADYRNASGIVIEDGPYGPTIAIEDTSRVDPWFVRQANETAAACREALAEFSRQARAGSND